MVPFTICAFAMNTFSGIGPMAVCRTAIPAVAAISFIFSSQLKTSKYRLPVKIIVLILLFAPFYYTTARHDWEFTAYDVLPEQANVRIEKGFGRGIYTNQLYSKLYDWLIANADYFTRPEDYAISYVVSPMVHMITRLRPSLDDTFISPLISNDYYKKCIEKMKQRKREPKIAFIFERLPVIVGGTKIFPEKQLDFATSMDPISFYIKKNMTPVSSFKISDDHIVRCYVDFSLTKN